MSTPIDLFALFLHFLTLSLLAIGGAITTVPEMHRFLVDKTGWLSDTGFTASIALAQAAPGPNILFVAVLGYNVAGLAGAAASMAGIMLPSSVLTLTATRWARRNREHVGVRAFSAGMTPLTLGLIIATGWLLALPFLKAEEHRWGTLALMAATVALTLKTRLSLVWMVLAGGVLGALGFV
ncbi:chromate transporter [Roseateles saccharophilus]|uniref:Chromate transporter n=1 Tax=Roseateles saccharophilus TaxID=304 RepID=A0A4R3VET1_ROSSA|nr:chromate transporter [Roseateles saccharophilus]MDG0832445.1 chromate transporter [Roseateles saccharophilus]TCV03906.1 chromate transporter [Roseateles saccharophilus]